jgi:hypothetical protein
MFRVFVFDSKAYTTITMYCFRKRQHTLLLQCIFFVQEGDGKGVTLITLNSYVETYDGLLMGPGNWGKIKVLYSSYVERVRDRQRNL